jgi:hypothetical protein
VCARGGVEGVGESQRKWRSCDEDRDRMGGGMTEQWIVARNGGLSFFLFSCRRFVPLFISLKSLI